MTSERFDTRAPFHPVVSRAAVGALVVVCLGLLGLALLTQRPWDQNVAAVNTAGTEPCVSASPMAGGVVTWCYAAGDVEAAEHRLPFAPVDPRVQVSRLSGVTLSTVVLYSGPGPQPYKDKRPEGIEYLFDDTTGISRGMTSTTPPRATWVQVSETGGAAATERATIDRLKGVSGVIGGAQKRYYGTWDYIGPVGGRLSVTVDSDGPRSLLRAIGSSLARQK